MKKVMSLLLVLVMAGILGLTAAAADNAVSPYWAADHTDEAPKLKLSKNQVVLGLDNNTVLLPGTFILPGKEYTYQLFRVEQDYDSVAPNAVAMTPIDNTMLGSTEFRVRTISGSSNVVSAKISKKGNYYYFVIETKEDYGTKINDLRYDIIQYGEEVKELTNLSVLLQTGYREMPDDVIAGYSEGDYVTIDNNTPVITKEQFETLGENYNYSPVAITGPGGDWVITGRIFGMNSVNFYSTNKMIEEIVMAEPDYDYKFVDFPAEIKYPTNAEMRINVSEIYSGTETEGPLYAYLYKEGELIPISTTFDETSGEIVFRTNYLGSFVVVTGEITQNMLPENEPPEENNNDIPLADLPVQNPDNPSTGADKSMNIMVMAALALLAGAGAVRLAANKSNEG